MRVQRHVDIQASPPAVFAVLDNSDRLAEWVEGIVENEELDMKEGVVGSTFRQVYEENGKRMEFAGVVTAYEKNEAMAIHLDGQGFDLDVGYRLQPLDSGAATRVVQDSVIHFKGMWKLAGFLFSRAICKASGKKQDEDFARLKRLCEA